METTYGYDPLGRRVFKRTGDACTWFGWDGDTVVAEGTGETPQAGPVPPPYRLVGLLKRQAENHLWPAWQAQREYVYYPETFVPLALVDDSGSYRYHNDPNGCPTRLTCDEGRVVWAARHNVWGQARVWVNEIANPIRLQGQYEDGETGLHYNRHRYYDPSSGSYISADPVDLDGGVNLYAYGNSNPFFWADPLGLASCEANLRSIDEQLARGRRARIDVKSKEEAEELLRAYISGPAGRPGAFRNTTGQLLPEGRKADSGSDWLPGGRGAYQREGTYHWDAANPNANAGDHAIEGNHLQIHNFDGKIIRVFFP